MTNGFLGLTHLAGSNRLAYPSDYPSNLMSKKGYSGQLPELPP